MKEILDESTLGTQIVRDSVLPSKSRQGKSVRVVELKFTSQNWHGMVWRHPARIYVPEGYQGGGGAGIFATARKFFDDAVNPQHTIDATQQNTEEQYAEATAIDLNIPIMIFSNPPENFQGMDEDDLMGFALKKAVETGDLSWYGYAAITTGYLRAITLMHSLPGIHAERAVLMGCSKRGVAVGLATGVDPDRVAGIMAACYTGGNVLYGVARQFAEFGPMMRGPAKEKLGPGYQPAENVLRVFNTPTGLELIKQFDPYIWRNKIKSNYLVTLGTNDEFFALGAANSMMKELRGDKAYLAIDNVKHAWVSPKHLAAWRVWLAHTFLSRGIPKIESKNSLEGDQLLIQAKTDKPASAVVVKAFYSYNKITDDWRAAQWQSVPMTAAEGGYSTRLPLKEGFKLAYYVEVEDSGVGGTGYISSVIEIVE
nr:PhoPQ-activated protein PqaA family protein [Roseateles koreensis]